MTVLPVAVATIPVIVDVPPMLSVALVLSDNPPVPMSAVPTVNVPLLVSVNVVAVILGIDSVPFNTWWFVLKV